MNPKSGTRSHARLHAQPRAPSPDERGRREHARRTTRAVPNGVRRAALSHLSEEDRNAL